MTILGYLRLVRLPNVCTALADILAGYAISSTRPPEGETGLVQYLPLFGASAALYLSGMAFNDIADREEDAEMRPQRPLPSGQVSVWGALACAVALMGAGIGLAAWCGAQSLLRAGLLAAAILMYNFHSKKNPVTGPLMLGSCRFFNVQLGLTGNPLFGYYSQPVAAWSWTWAPAIAVGVYAAGVTAFSAQEETGKKRWALSLGWLFCAAGILWAGVTGLREAWIALAPLALTLSFLTHRLRRVGTPAAARDLVRAGVMGICVLDAGLILAFVGLDGWPCALLSVALLAPGFLLAKLLAQKEA